MTVDRGRRVNRRGTTAPDDLRRAFLGREHLKRVQPPWEGGPLETDLLGLD